MLKDFVLAFDEGVEIATRSGNQKVIHIPRSYKELPLKEMGQGMLLALETLASGGTSETELSAMVKEADGEEALSSLYYCLTAFAQQQILTYGVAHQGQSFATLIPLSRLFYFVPPAIDPKASYALSRFAYMHRDSDRLVLESPLAHGQIALSGKPGMDGVAGLVQPQTLASLGQVLPGLPEDKVLSFLQLLVGGGFVTQFDEQAPYPGENETLVQWDFHDLLFHARSRKGRHRNPFGGTYRFNEKIEPPAAVKAIGGAELYQLPKPDISALEEEDYPLTLVLEHRKSIREYADDEPITLEQLGEFLYRTARVKKYYKTDIQDITQRPYPAGGSLYEMELYVSVAACQGLEKGIYHYCPARHLLTKLNAHPKAVEKLIKDGTQATGVVDAPQVLITITARFQRISWKYQTMAYALMLKHVGVLYQTMYLVATAMELAPCALGGGDSDLFAFTTGVDYYSEGSVGEFLLGSKRV
jgi:SagB-type dehydrogenase family enzyme